MSGARLEVQWSPIHNNKFITWGTEICLYEVDALKNYANKSCMRLSDTTEAHLLATNSNHHYVKCVDIYPKVNSDLFLAVGQANGRVALTTFGPSEFDAVGLSGRELVPRHARQCNAVAWNPIEPNIVVAGLDKYRADHSLLIWDIKKCSISNENNGSTSRNTNNSHHNALAAVELPKPISEFGVNETTNSLAWFITQPRTLAVGINQKNIKIVDVRDSQKAVNSAPTKCVHGLSVHPHNDRHLASFSDNVITIWDTRNFERPILSLTHNKPVVKIHWSLTRHNLLGSLQRDSSVIHLHDIQHTVIGNEEVEPSVLERTVAPGSPHNITSFSWHPQDENRLLTIALSGNITDYIVFERITLNWAPNSNMSWTFGRKTLKYIDESTGINLLQDISSKIKQRCLDGYGLKAELWQNGDVTKEPLLMNVWSWLHLSRSLVELGDLRPNGTKHPGVKSILKMDNSSTNGNSSSSLKSDICQTPWLELGNMHCHGSARIYRSEERDKALHLCGWRFDKDINLLSLYLEKLEKEHAYSRAAAIAVFALKIRLAIDILNRGAEKLENNNLNIVAMALAGFTDDKNSMWRQLCFNTKAQLNDPYLRSMFSFLTAENYNYDHVLNETGMSVEDRVAFACLFLSDKKLYEYLTTFTVKLIEEGNLNGLLLTGTVKEGLTLLQKYLDTTGDIQTTTLIAVKAFSPELLQETCVQEWILSYRNLLDSWHFWNQRAHFDIMLSSCSPADKPPQQVYVSCNFCGKSISAYMQGLNRGRGTYSRLGATSNKLKMSSCPNCRKPLPRCAICLMHMGTPSGGPGHTGPDGEKMVEFASWFTWCQSCRHGGHASHMIHWFKEHSECPVTPCNCRCFSVDAVDNLVSAENM